MIVIIDYKMGNVGSIANMLKKAGEDAVISSDIETIRKADKLIICGVGSFDFGMNNLRSGEFVEIIKEHAIIKKTPILGICLGMQLFSRKSEEGVSDGLGLIEGEVKKFKFENNNLKIPHMGWNTASVKKEDPILSNMLTDFRFYFVHSYHFIPDNNEDVIAVTNYGYDFASVVRKDNVIGVQFHPEKSHKFGMQLLKNFAQIC